ncbi:hypothetical protein V6N11_047038 [Hibiscus sabdariffa]|uniref:DUF4283 domain-containing protein n=1 Tax=Hibiscus sabdariffa TaxID=183260 RepID=A0ABR2NAH7_9ROSI
MKGIRYVLILECWVISRVLDSKSRDGVGSVWLPFGTMEGNMVDGLFVLFGVLLTGENLVERKVKRDVSWLRWGLFVRISGMASGFALFGLGNQGWFIGRGEVIGKGSECVQWKCQSMIEEILVKVWYEATDEGMCGWRPNGSTPVLTSGDVVLVLGGKGWLAERGMMDCCPLDECMVVGRVLKHAQRKVELKIGGGLVKEGIEGSMAESMWRGEVVGKVVGKDALNRIAQLAEAWGVIPLDVRDDRIDRGFDLAIWHARKILGVRIETGRFGESNLHSGNRCHRKGEAVRFDKAQFGIEEQNLEGWFEIVISSMADEVAKLMSNLNFSEEEMIEMEPMEGIGQEQQSETARWVVSKLFTMRKGPFQFGEWLRVPLIMKRNGSQGVKRQGIVYTDKEMGSVGKGKQPVGNIPTGPRGDGRGQQGNGAFIRPRGPKRVLQGKYEVCTPVGTKKARSASSSLVAEDDGNLEVMSPLKTITTVEAVEQPRREP